MTLVMGAVAYDPKVVTIWSGFRSWLSGHGLEFDFMLYSNYERQVEDLVQGRIHAAWNSPLAWLRARRLATAHGIPVQASVMRDTDRDLSSVIIARTDSPHHEIADLKGERIAVGAIDSPQATLIPLSYLRQHGVVAGENLEVRRYDIGVGLHGDHIGGERAAAKALVGGEVAAACLIDSNLLLFNREGTVAAGAVRVLGQTPPYDHCNLTIGASCPRPLADTLERLLLAMSYEDADVRPLLDLEGLTRWVPGRTDGYQALNAAVNEGGFYDAIGAITAQGYRP